MESPWAPRDQSEHRRTCLWVPKGTNRPKTDNDSPQESPLASPGMRPNLCNGAVKNFAHRVVAPHHLHDLHNIAHSIAVHHDHSAPEWAPPPSDSSVSHGKCLDLSKATLRRSRIRYSPRFLYYANLLLEAFADPRRPGAGSAGDELKVSRASELSFEMACVKLLTPPDEYDAEDAELKLKLQLLTESSEMGGESGVIRAGNDFIEAVYQLADVSLRVARGPGVVLCYVVGTHSGDP